MDLERYFSIVDNRSLVLSQGGGPSHFVAYKAKFLPKFPFNKRTYPVPQLHFIAIDARNRNLENNTGEAYSGRKKTRIPP